MALNPKHKSVVFIDIGHAQCRLLVVSPQLRDLRVHETATQGLTKGKVTDRAALTETILRLTNAAQINTYPYIAILNTPASHTRSVFKSINYRLSGIYRPCDYDAIIELAQDSFNGGLDEVIDLMPLQMKVDDRIIDPYGFGEAGESITLRLMLATPPRILLSDLLACVNAAGVEIAEFRSNAFGVARALKYLRPVSENSVLLDIGHSTVTGALQVGGAINQVFCVPAGSAHISRDLSIGLGINFEEAEALKLNLGLPEKQISNETTNKIRQYTLPRVSELMSLSFRNFAIYSRSLDGGLLLTGRGAQFSGLADFIARRFAVKSPFMTHISNTGARTFVGLLPNDREGEATCEQDLVKIDSGWLSVLAQARNYVLHQKAIQEERNQRPLARLRPLWTWLSELSR